MKIKLQCSGDTIRLKSDQGGSGFLKPLPEEDTRFPKGTMVFVGAEETDALPVKIQKLLGIVLNDDAAKLADKSPALLLTYPEHRINLEKLPDSFHSLLHKEIPLNSDKAISQWLKKRGFEELPRKEAKKILRDTYKNWGDLNGYDADEIDSIVRAVEDFIDHHPRIYNNY